MDQQASRVRSIFDSQPTGGFTLVMRGYDRVQVETHIRQLEQAVQDATARINELESQASALRGDLGDVKEQLNEVERPS